MAEKDETDVKSKEDDKGTEGVEYNKGASQMEKNLEVQKIIIENDKDEDGILDLEDFVQGARMEANNKPIYRSKYYLGGYPPEHEGVCTDVIWRSFKNAGYNLKEMIDKDIKEHTADYTRVEGRPDPNIDFRRVPNQLVFFRKHAIKITNELKPNDANNLKQWQGGDIVVFRKPEHIAIVSDIRRNDGVPFIIHNSGPYAKEEDDLEMWMADDGIIGHFRFPKLN
jgi:uncharacterized protein YijF (DUF1287 family)